MEPTTLNVGFVKEGSIYDDAVEEMLNHQGVILSNPSDLTTRRSKAFPCVILSGHTDRAYETASKYCVNEDNIVIVDEKLPLERVLCALSGISDANNQMVPFVTQQEKMLVELVMSKYSELDLPFLQKWFWPDFAKACCLVTHDVDWLYYSPFHRAVLKRRPFNKFLKLAFTSMVSRKNYGNNIASIVQEEEKRGLKSSFYFTTKYDSHFQQDLMKAVDLLARKRFEIGLHGYNSHKDKQKLIEQKETLESRVGLQIKGIRQHALKFSVPHTWEIEEEVGMSYDLTFFHNDKFGFRSGTCLPYHPLIRDKTRRLSILEIPTCFMDYTVLYNQMNYEQSRKTMEEILKTVELFNGVFGVCFHNTYLNEEMFPEIFRLYTDLLDFKKEMNFWMPTDIECYLWWIRRERTEIRTTLKERTVEIETSTYPLPLTVSAQKERMNLDMPKKSLQMTLRHLKK